MRRRPVLLEAEDGQTLVEAALSMSLMLTMLFGIMTGGWMLYTYHYLSYAARVGARYAVVRGSSCDNSSGMPDCPNVTSDQVQTFVKSVHYAGIDSTLLTITATWPNGTDNAGDPVQVTARYPFAVPLPFFNTGSVAMHSTSQMVISQ
jgi:Flp pilus assembly protein TadG